MPTYVLVTFLEDVRDGAEFAASDWPLHLTLLPNFTIGWDATALRARLRPVLTGRRPITVLAAREALFGPRGTVPVNVLEREPELLSLHRAMHDVVAAAGGDFGHPDYVGEGYRPHVTVQRHRRVRQGRRGSHSRAVDRRPVTQRRPEPADGPRHARLPRGWLEAVKARLGFAVVNLLWLRFKISTLPGIP